MASEEHLALLKQGVEVWNRWREEHSEILPDLSEANLLLANLHGANLCKTELSFARLRSAKLRGANLQEAHLGGADMSWADLREANLSRADLREANLARSDLSRASLREADLRTAVLNGAFLTQTRFEKAVMYQTLVGDVDLSETKELDKVKHRGPSIIGFNTIYYSRGIIPEIFLRGAGAPDSFMTYMRSLVGKPIEYYSCFISYSSQDEEFSRRLYEGLQAHNVRSWFAPEDLKIGDHYHQRIEESIRLYDKLVLILSEHAVRSSWVEREVAAAREKEERTHRLVLFPVRLDDAVFQTDKEWAADVRRRWHIGDFTQWKHHDVYQQAFQRLLRDLKAENTPNA